MSAAVDRVKQQKQAMIAKYAKPDDLRGLLELLGALVPLMVFWWLAVRLAPVSLWLTAGAGVFIVAFLVRCFALMHEYGHYSQFRARRFNRWAGFVFGVINGMPQPVWAQNHNYHHVCNGDWERYKGPYTTKSVDEYAALTPGMQRLYRARCSVLVTPLVGFIYLIFNPRFNWLRGSLAYLLHMAGISKAARGVPFKQRGAAFHSRIWRNRKDYWAMFWNNVALLSLWAVMSWWCGPGLFFSIYLTTLSLAGAVGIILFTVQHNFEGSYASHTADWDYDAGAIHGTSYMLLPAWLNWFTANMAYHHIHHLSTVIPGYRLARCHEEFAHLFTEVSRLRLSQVPHALRCILWDTRKRQIITFVEYRDRMTRPQVVTAG